MVVMARRAFLQARVQATAFSIRPPWSIPEQQFLNDCTRCNDCISACPNNIITVGSGGYPVIDFQRGACVFCDACIKACDANALQRTTPEAPAWNLVLTITDACLAFKKIECRVCAEVCQESAIRFPPRLGGIAWPLINNELCTGCGACISPCPSTATSLN